MRIFFDRPIAATMLAIALFLLLLGMKPLITQRADWRKRLGFDAQTEK